MNCHILQSETSSVEHLVCHLWIYLELPPTQNSN